MELPDIPAISVEVAQFGQPGQLGEIMNNRTNIAIRNNAAKAAKAAFDAQVMNVTNRTRDDITVIIDIPDKTDNLVITGKRDVWDNLPKHLKPGEYTGTVTHRDNVLNVRITVTTDNQVIRRVSHWTR
jgi:hypothetical protein